MSDPVLRLARVTAGYAGVPAVREVDLSVAAGEIVVLLGANGAGKTTTLRAISGLVRPMQGRISVGGADLAALSPTGRARMGIAHVPERRGLFMSLTVAEHFRLGHRGERLDERVAFDIFPPLAPLRHRRVGLLSGGEQQMVAVGRALARRPRLLLLDELSLGLAPVVVERLIPVVREYAWDSGCAVLLVEQRAHLALPVADRGYVLSRGRVVLHGPAERLRGNQGSLISAYLGSSPTNGDRPAAAGIDGDPPSASPPAPEDP